MSTATHTTKNGNGKATLSNHLGLETARMEQLSETLNALLSDYHVFYQNVRGYHWNVKGNDFFDLHEKFEELYTALNENIDALAERIVTIGYRPLHTFSDFQKHTRHKEIRNVSEGKECVKHVLEGLGMIVASHRKATREASGIDDIATADLLTRFTGDLEKRLWMFTMYNK